MIGSKIIAYDDRNVLNPSRPSYQNLISLAAIFFWFVNRINRNEEAISCSRNRSSRIIKSHRPQNQEGHSYENRHEIKKTEGTCKLEGKSCNNHQITGKGQNNRYLPYVIDKIFLSLATNRNRRKQ